MGSSGINARVHGVSDTTARGLLMLRPIPMFTTDTDWDTSDMLDTSDMDTDTDTAMDTCTARGLLMLSLRPIPTFSTVDSDTPDTDWDTTSALLDISDTDTDSDTAPDTTTASRLHQDLSVNQ